MKNLILCVCAALLIFSCKQNSEEVKILSFSGTISNADSDSIFIIDRGNDYKEGVAVMEDGTFSGKFELPKTGFYTFYDGNESTKVYLFDNDSVTLKYDAEEFDETLEYSGLSAEINHYLKNKFLKEEQVMPSKDFYTLNADEFYEKSVEIKKEQLASLKDANVQDTDFNSIEEQNINFAHLNNFENYEAGYNYYTKTKNGSKNEKMNSELKEVDWDNESYFNSVPSYKNLLSSKISNSSNFEEEKSFIEKIKSKDIQSYLVKILKYKVSAGNEQLKEYFAFIHPKLEGEEATKLEVRYNSALKLEKGAPAPKFNYENHKGGETSLEDLKGKYVYIDVWATWCGPCLREIPSLKEVEAKYHDKNIEFVSVSIDEQKDYDTWKTMVNEKELKGIQLVADKAWESNIVKDYIIDGIPRFVLIDPEGNIIDSDAPRPSNEELTKTLDEIL